LAIYEDKCVICQHPQRALIEELYQRGTPQTELAKIIDPKGHHETARREMTYHAQALGLAEKRLGEWRNFYQAFLDAGADALALGEVSADTKARLALQAQKQLDEIEGRTDKKQIDMPNLQFIAIPAPGGARVEIPAVGATIVIEEPLTLTKKSILPLPEDPHDE